MAAKIIKTVPNCTGTPYNIVPVHIGTPPYRGLYRCTDMYQIKNLHQTKYQSMTTEQTTATFRRMKRRAATKAKAQEPQPQPQPTPTGQPNIRELLPEDGSFHFFLNRIGGRGR